MLVMDLNHARTATWDRQTDNQASALKMTYDFVIARLARFSKNLCPSPVAAAQQLPSPQIHGRFRRVHSHTGPERSGVAA